MRQNSPKAVILLALAKVQGQPEHYLRNLPEELRQLQRILRPGKWGVGAPWYGNQPE